MYLVNFVHSKESIPSPPLEQEGDSRGTLAEDLSQLLTGYIVLFAWLWNVIEYAEDYGCELADLEFSDGSERVCAHSALLAARCDYYRALFRSGTL